MHKIMCGFKRIKPDSFTLVELLVVISIIGLLAGLATPAISKGLEKGKQTVDLSNGRQLSLLLFAYANDDSVGGGTFPTNGTTSTQIFQDLINNNFLTSVKVLGGNGVPPPPSTNNIVAANVYWAYTKGLTLTDGNVPLLSTKGTLTDVTTLNNISPSSTSPWKNKGFVVVTADNSATWYTFTNNVVTPKWMNCTNQGVIVLQP
ncbi:MAG: type II secretion system protein [Verrucomicrobia bacterium]|nr:type II secretion system protein [Verrucomicrobiota bacterium]